MGKTNNETDNPGKKLPGYRKISPQKVSTLANALGNSTQFGAASLGVTGQVNREVALYLMAIPVVVVAIVDLIGIGFQTANLCMDRRNACADRSLYLSIFMVFVLVSLSGAGLAFWAAANDSEEDNVKATIAAALITLGMFARGALHTPNAKRTTKATIEEVKETDADDDSGDLEEGRELRHLKKSK